MRFRRVSTALITVFAALMVAAPSAFAHAPGGQGWYGPTTDQVITNAMFIVIIAIPVLILLFSLIQWRLDKRKHARMDAAKRRAVNVDWRGGW